MRPTLIRTIVNVSKQDGLWSVQDGGEAFGHSPDKEIARAAAHVTLGGSSTTGRHAK